MILIRLFNLRLHAGKNKFGLFIQILGRIPPSPSLECRTRFARQVKAFSEKKLLWLVLSSINTNISYSAIHV